MNVERKNAKDDLRLYMPEVIGMLKREGKFPAMHVYACTLRSYEKFCAEERYPKNTTASLSMQEIFTPERLKEYEDWLGGGGGARENGGLDNSPVRTRSPLTCVRCRRYTIAGCHRA